MRLPAPWLVFVLVGVAAGAAWYLLTRTPGPGSPPAIEQGLAWLPAEAGLIASLHVDEIRQQGWLLGLLEQGSGVEQEAEYQEFVAATGFDYARDLTRVWLAVMGDSERGWLAGVARGRFAPQKIVSYAREQGASSRLYRDVPIYVAPAATAGAAPARQFAFAFIDETQLVFGDSGDGVEAVLDCVVGKAPAVTSDPARKAHLERFAAGMHAWAMNDVARWTPPPLAKRPELAAQVQQWAIAARVTATGIELVGEAQTRQAGQAATLGELLRGYILLSRGTLAARGDAASQALARILGELELESEDRLLSAKVWVSAETFKTLLTAPSIAVGESRGR